MKKNHYSEGSEDLAVLSREAVGASSLEVLKARMDGALGSLPHLLGENQHKAAGWSIWSLRSLPTQTTLWFYDSIFLWLFWILHPTISEEDATAGVVTKLDSFVVFIGLHISFHLWLDSPEQCLRCKTESLHKSGMDCAFFTGSGRRWVNTTTCRAQPGGVVVQKYQGGAEGAERGGSSHWQAIVCCHLHLQNSHSD